MWCALSRRWFKFIGLSLATLVGIIVTSASAIHAISPVDQTLASLALPPAQVHPLPPMFLDWQSSEQQGDYFDQVKPTRVGYLIWSHFPIQIYVAAATAMVPNAEQIWRPAVIKAIQDWQEYFPLTVTEQPDLADITIEQVKPNQKSQGRIRSGETRYQLYIDADQKLSHRFTIKLRPNQTAKYITAGVRHELGHALGIWGHSLEATDALYFSQVRTPPPISRRDLNTLKRVYQQPTRLGWTVGANISDEI